MCEHLLNNVHALQSDLALDESQLTFQVMKLWCLAMLKREQFQSKETIDLKLCKKKMKGFKVFQSARSL